MKQTQALDILKMGKNVFLTGSAGSGKTYVLNSYIEYLKKHKIGVGITAATGIAATHLGGTTIHSWSGIGIKDKLSNNDIKFLLKKPYLKKHFFNNDVLIIDEISMLHANQLDLVNNLCQAFRQSIQPFGGLQIILSGDFFQLPPIGKNNQIAQWATESEVWQNMDLNICYLTEQYRQEDIVFLNILNEIRNGKVSPYSKKLLFERLNKTLDDKPEPTKLYTHNVDVENINLQELSKINSQPYSYLMKSRGNKKVSEILKKSCLAPENLVIKKGAKVMFVKNNFEQGVVNGTVGRVIDFDENNFPIILTTKGQAVTAYPTEWTIDEDGRAIAQIRQLPLRLAWAITVHKSQGLSLDLAEVDLSKSFIPGMGYVALSRIRSLDGLFLKGLNEMALHVDQNILKTDKQFRSKSEETIGILKKFSEEEKNKAQKIFVKNNFEKPIIIKNKKISNKEKTKELVKKRLSIEKIADEQGFTKGTIVNHIEELLKTKKLIPDDIKYLLPDTKDYKKIKLAFDKCGWEKLKPVFEYLEEKYDYDILKLVRMSQKKL
ncbi:MAG: helix-turn-helix domain-containing protein [Patescibacteria group bacterium]